MHSVLILWGVGEKSKKKSDFRMYLRVSKLISLLGLGWQATVMVFLVHVFIVLSLVPTLNYGGTGLLWVGRLQACVLVCSRKG